MAKRTIKGEKADEIINQFPKAATLTLARILYKKYPSVYVDVEDARSALRRNRGENGSHNRKSGYYKQNNGQKYDITLPESWARKKEFFKIPEAYKKVGIISDIQCPFHDNDAINHAINHLIEVGIDCLLINGDAIDFYSLSSFEKDPTKRNFAEERIACIDLLTYIKEKFKDIPVYYNLDANHENRFEKYMQKKAPELLSTEFFMVEDLMMLHDIGIIPIRGYDHIRIGNLPIIHGHTVFRGQTSPVSPARTVYMKMKHSCVASHCHRVSQYTWVDMKGEPSSTWTTGCLMNLNVEYNPHGNDYVHGFAYVSLDSKGNFIFHNKMIVEGKIC
jgi:hypothetical protein